MWHERQMVAFDLETTGVDVFTDRIVTACIATIDGANVHAREWLVNPEIHIPAGAAAVHGITTEKAQTDGADYPTAYGEIRDALDSAWAAGHSVVAFNAAFDLSLVNSEGLRLGYRPLVPRTVVDPFVLDMIVGRHRKGQRNLAATCGHYRLAMGEAHNAAGDALAAARLAWRFARFPGLAGMSSEDLMVAQTEAYRVRQEQRASWLLGEGRPLGDLSTVWPIREPGDAYSVAEAVSNA